MLRSSPENMKHIEIAEGIAERIRKNPGMTEGFDLHRCPVTKPFESRESNIRPRSQ